MGKEYIISEGARERIEKDMDFMLAGWYEDGILEGWWPVGSTKLLTDIVLNAVRLIEGACEITREFEESDES